MIEVERLIALALDELSGEELDRVELHVLSCSSCARTLEALLGLGPATRDLLRAGKVKSYLLSKARERLDALGLITRRYRLSPEQVVPCGVTSDDVYVLTELEVALEGASRVDLLFSGAVGQWRESDVPFDAASGVVAYIDRGDVLRQMPSMRLEVVVVAVENDAERALGKYTLDHRAFVGD